MSDRLDLIIVGAGPAGLSCGIEAAKRGFRFLILEKGCVVNSIYHFPVNMTFFTTADLLEIGGLPLTCAEDKPKRVEVLKYYRRVCQYFNLPLRDYEKVVQVRGEDGRFQVDSLDRFGEEHRYSCRKLIIATGYYDNPNRLGIPGEDLPKVSHYYSEPHPYYGKKVVVIGGKNSAAEAALDLYRNAAAEVTLIHRGEGLGREIKYWVLPDISNRIRKGEIRAFFSSRLREIREKEVIVETPHGETVLENDFVLAMTGYHPDRNFLTKLGIEVDPETYVPQHDPETLESNVKGIYLAGAIVSGKMTNRVFIENGRFHGEQIFKHWPSSEQCVQVGE